MILLCVYQNQYLYMDINIYTENTCVHIEVLSPPPIVRISLQKQAFEKQIFFLLELSRRVHPKEKQAHDNSALHSIKAHSICSPLYILTLQLSHSLLWRKPQTFFSYLSLPIKRKEKSCIILNYLDITSLRHKCASKNFNWFKFIIKEKFHFHGLSTDQNKLAIGALNFERNFSEENSFPSSRQGNRGTSHRKTEHLLATILQIKISPDAFDRNASIAFLVTSENHSCRIETLLQKLIPINLFIIINIFIIFTILINYVNTNKNNNLLFNKSKC